MGIHVDFTWAWKNICIKFKWWLYNFNAKLFSYLWGPPISGAHLLHNSAPPSFSLPPWNFFSRTHARVASRGLNEEQQQFQQLALEFAKQELAPYMKQWDEDVSSTINKCMAVEIWLWNFVLAADSV